MLWEESRGVVEKDWLSSISESCSYAEKGHRARVGALGIGIRNKVGIGLGSGLYRENNLVGPGTGVGTWFRWTN